MYNTYTFFGYYMCTRVTYPCAPFFLPLADDGFALCISPLAASPAYFRLVYWNKTKWLPTAESFCAILIQYADTPCSRIQLAAHNTQISELLIHRNDIHNWILHWKEPSFAIPVCKDTSLLYFSNFHRAPKPSEQAPGLGGMLNGITKYPGRTIN